MKLILAAIITTLVFAASVANSATGPPALPPDVLDAADLGQALTPNDMGMQTGRQGVTIDEMTNTLNSTEASGSVGSNALTSMATGTNIVSDNAFGATNGVATVIQNSGNQNVIQSSFILNLSVK